jgi:hypothetical protein
MKVILPLFMVPVMPVLFGPAPIVLADIDTSTGAPGYFDQGYSQGKNDKLVVISIMTTAILTMEILILIVPVQLSKQGMLLDGLQLVCYMVDNREGN